METQSCSKISLLQSVPSMILLVEGTGGGDIAEEELFLALEHYHLAPVLFLPTSC
jgi:hypothetical protein